MSINVLLLKRFDGQKNTENLEMLMEYFTINSLYCHTSQEYHKALFLDHVFIYFVTSNLKFTDSH